ncbi:MAG: DUF1816 domain-containing protein [Cyanobacteriota bacterium ELA615]|jgi:hypothetical protein
MSELLLKLLDTLGLAYWAEIRTENPKCVYYFGPFASLAEAKTHHTGYLEDLQSEGAQSILVDIKRCKPTVLTIDEEGSHENLSTKIVNINEHSS